MRYEYADNVQETMTVPQLFALLDFLSAGFSSDEPLPPQLQNVLVEAKPCAHPTPIYTGTGLYCADCKQGVPS